MTKESAPSHPAPANRPAARQPHEHPGLVVAHHGGGVLVEDSHGTLVRCTPRRKVEKLVCGDRVRWEPTGDGEGVIAGIVPRDSVLARPEPSGGRRAVAANVTQIVVVVAVQPDPSEYLIDRYIVTAEVAGIHPVIVLNKIDLGDPSLLSALEQRLAVYGRLGYRVLLTSVRQSHGIDTLVNALQGETSVLVGQSGVGKSSLVQALLPEQEVAVGALTGARHGRHTTSTATLYHLPAGGDLIDSPGVRDFGVWHLDATEVARGFVEFEPYLGRCRFHNCRHAGEPGCAVQQALEKGEIDARRLESYRQMLAAL